MAQGGREKNDKNHRHHPRISQKKNDQNPPPTPNQKTKKRRITSTPGGAQLMNIQLPLQLCEPMSEIQRRAEILIPGVRCLDAAASAPPLSLERLLRVTAYAASTYACTVRTSKCVSPVLGETMDALVPELGVRMLSEFVAADKNRARGGYMGSAWVVEGRGWTVSGDDAPLASLRASGLEIQAAFRSRLEFADGDVYDWARVSLFLFSSPPLSDSTHSFLSPPTLWYLLLRSSALFGLPRSFSISPALGSIC